MYLKQKLELSFPNQQAKKVCLYVYAYVYFINISFMFKIVQAYKQMRECST